MSMAVMAGLRVGWSGEDSSTRSGGEFHLVIDLAERDLAVRRRQRKGRIEAAYGGVKPLVVVPTEMFDDVLVLPNQHVLLQRIDRLIPVELPSAIATLRAVREHFENDEGIEKNVTHLIVELRLSADDRVRDVLLNP